MSRLIEPKGFALVAVLWMLVLLTFFAGMSSSALRTEAVSVRNATNQAAARQAALGGLEVAVGRLMSPNLSEPNIDVRYTFEGTDLHLTSADESGKIDLNFAPPQLLSSLFSGAGAGHLEAESLAAAVLDWRDPDDTRRLNGAEANDYLRENGPFQIGNRPFASVRELEKVLGMTDVLVRKVSPALTVYSRNPGFDYSKASGAVRSLLPSISRQSGQRGDTYTVRVTAERSEQIGIAVCIEAVVLLRPDIDGRLYTLRAFDYCDTESVVGEGV